MYVAFATKLVRSVSSSFRRLPDYVFLRSVSPNKGHPFAINLVLKTQDGTAIGRTDAGPDFAPGEDFKHRPGLRLFFPSSPDSKERTPDFRIAQDQIDEEDETFTYTIELTGNPNVEIVKDTGTVTIRDDDPPSSVSIADGSAEEDAGTISFVVSLDHESGKRIGVAWETADGTAVAGDDYEHTRAVVEFAPGVTARTISVAVIDDGDREPDGESFQVTLSRAAGTEEDDLALGDTVATGTINPSDLNFPPTGAPVISGGPPTVGEELTAEIGGIADGDGLVGATFEFQWIADGGTGGTDIDGATAASYTPREEDVGKTLAVRVTFTDDANAVETLTSAATQTVAAAPPDQVGNVTVTADVGQLLVSWDEVADTAGYKVQWKSGTQEFNTGDRQDEVSGGSTTTHTIRSLLPGTEYTVQVSAVRDNARVDGAPSDPATATPKVTAPGQVTGVVLTPAAEALEVTWGAVTDAGGYKVQWRSDTQQFGADRQDEVAGGSTTTHTIDELDPATTYTVQVIATRQFADDGPASPAASARPRYQPPAKVTLVNVSNGVEQLLVGWRVQNEADAYRVQWKSGTEEFGADREVVVRSDEVLPYAISPLNPGTEYTVQVIATRDNADDAEPSDPVTGVPVAPAEDQVSGVTLEAEVGRLLVSWNQASGALGYRVQWRSGAQEFNTGDRQQEITGAATTSAVIEGLDADLTYTVQVTARFQTYDGPPSSPATARPQYPAPGRVTGVAVESEVRQLRVTWNRVSDATGYKVQWRTGGQEFGGEREAVVAGGATGEYVIPSLRAGTEYTVQVLAVRDNAEDGVASESAAGTPEAPLPGQVGGVSVAAGVGELTVTWIEASDAAGYKVQWKSGNQAFGGGREAVVAGATSTEYVIASLESGTEYTVRVIATNESDEEGEPSLEVVGTPKVAAAGQVVNVSVTPGVEQLGVAWEEAADASGYRVQWKTGEQEFGGEREAVVDAATSEYVIQSLEAGTEYTVQVLATRENADDAPPSEPVTGIPLAPASGQVSGVRVTAGVEQLTVSWNALSEAGGYKVQWKTGEQEFGAEREAVIDDAATTEYVIGSLEAGTEYTVQVLATQENAADGVPSPAVAGIPQAAPPGRVTNVTVTPGEGQLAVSWDEARDADGYRVQWAAGTREFSAVVSGGSSTSYTIGSLSAGVEYLVQVLATRDNAPDGAASEAVRATPEGTVGGDVVPPTVSIGSTAEFPVNGAFRVSIRFSESVTGMELEDIEVDNGAATELAGAGAGYSATITPRADFEGSVTVTVAAGAAADGAGNGSRGGSERFAVDTRAPTVQETTLEQSLEGWTATATR